MIQLTVIARNDMTKQSISIRIASPLARNDGQQIIVEELSMKNQRCFTLCVIPANAGIQTYWMPAFRKEFYL